MTTENPLLNLADEKKFSDDVNYSILTTEDPGLSLSNIAEKSPSKIAGIIICLLFAALVGLGIFDIVTVSQSQNWRVPADISCPVFPSNISYYVARQDLISFHATYDFNPNFNGKIQFVCASYNLDINLVAGDSQLVARTNRKILSTTSESEILDCHGNLLYITKTGDTWETIINQNKIVVSLEVHSPENEVIAYVEGTHFLGDEIKLLDLNGKTLAILNRAFFSIPPEWTFTVNNPEHPACDTRLLGIIAGMRHWIGKNPDPCNRTFWGVAWTWLVVGIISVLICCCLVGQLVKSKIFSSPPVII